MSLLLRMKNQMEEYLTRCHLIRSGNQDGLRSVFQQLLLCTNCMLTVEKANEAFFSLADEQLHRCKMVLQLSNWA